MRLKQLTFLAAATLALHAAAADQGWIQLSNGKDLSGWVQRGGNAKYAVEGDVIVGTSVLRTDNSFLCTEKTYGNFILEFDFKVDPRLNSGVQIRSECFDTARQVQWQGRTINIPARRVHGYQIEIDPEPARNRWWSAGIYDEARRLWLYPGQLGGDTNAFTDQGRRIFKQNDWNHVRVEAIGDSIKTWLNGTACAQIKDAMTLNGFIALQVHGIGNDTNKLGTQVRWRNVRIKENPAPGSAVVPPPAMNVRILNAEGASAGAAVSVAATLNALTDQEKKDGWRLLWDGKTTSGWRSPRSDAFPAKGWEIKDGALTVLDSGGGEAIGGGDIITVDRYSNFELVADFKLTPGANSGIKYFVQPNLDPVTGAGAKANAGSAIGCEFQVLDDERHPDAKLGRNGNRTVGSLYDLLPAATSKKPRPIGEWNTARILVQGKHVEHWLNGEKILEYDRGSPAFRETVALSKFKGIPGFGEWADGHILLQEHGNRVSYRNVKIRVPRGT